MHIALRMACLTRSKPTAGTDGTTFRLPPGEALAGAVGAQESGRDPNGFGSRIAERVVESVVAA
jgi:hypothetical protein